jgi:hypothetical protein
MPHVRKIHTNLPGYFKKKLDNSQFGRKCVLQSKLLYSFPQIIKNDNLKIFKIKFACVTSDTTKTSIKNCVYHYTTLHEMVICDSDRQLHITPIGNFFFQ